MRLIFIYNADAGFLGELTELAKKAAGSGCSLCSITHNLNKEKQGWAAYVAGLGIETSFLHRNEMPPAVKAFVENGAVALPAVLKEDGSGLSVFIDAAQLASCKGDEASLMRLLNVKLKA